MRFIASIFLILVFWGCSNSQKPHVYNENLAIIPKPNAVSKKQGNFIWNNQITLYADSFADSSAKLLQGLLNNSEQLSLKTGSKTEAQIQILQDSTLKSESYTIEITPELISLSAGDAAGAFYGVQTLRQLLPAQLEQAGLFKEPVFSIPAVRITDSPKFQHRGMHLDVSRHFFGVDEIKTYIDMLALLKMNRFHWHLTDDQGWRIEIKKYPKLTLKGAFRPETLLGHYNDTPQQFDNTQYGGFYTQEEIKTVVAYAQSKHITIIPEIEMPGHASAAISAYPELGCTREQIQVATSWGVFEDIFCPKPATFEFLQDVLDEVIALFPGEYIHIGGDEAPKARWENCSHCQGLIKAQELADEHELQSYFITKIEAYLNSKGRQIIGWDEILEGGLAPNATVMSWRGTQGAVAAAKTGHQVILSPTSHAYFDYYQSNNPDEPLAIGGYLPLKKVYGFSPYPTEMPEEDYQYVLGAQGNIWTEYMQDFKQVQYMAYPRTMAMSEVVWNGPTAQLEQDYSDFLGRLEFLFDRLDILGINYANHIYQINSKVVKHQDSIFYSLKSELPGKILKFRLNNDKNWNTYIQPLYIDKTTTIKSVIWDKEQPKGIPKIDSLIYHKGIKASITINKTPHPAYNSGGIQALNNGFFGSRTRYGDNEWLGFWGESLEITLNFDSPTSFNKLQLQFFHAPGQWIYSPNKGKLIAESVAGKLYQKGFEYSMNGTNLSKAVVRLEDEEFTQLTISIPNYGVIPAGKQGAGNKAWTFIDEIFID